jgi:perosamine synthetase
MKPIMDHEMIDAAVQALENEKLVLGESVYKFEEEFARFCGTRHAVSTASGTAALQIALEALEMERRAEVLTSPFSFIATANSILHAKSRPIFADVGKDGNLDVLNAADKMIGRTRALMPVHLYGHPFDVEAFRDLARDKEVFLVEDACQAHGATYNGRKAGSLGDVGCFSFYSSKNMTVGGDGGIITTDDDDVAEVARSIRDCGRLSKYTMARLGYTSRLNSVNAAIGRVQLARLLVWNERRRIIAGKYRELLSGISGIHLPPKDDNIISSVYHLFVIQSPYREQIKNYLAENGVEAGVHYPIPIHLQVPYKRIYGYTEGSFPESERLANQVLSLPIYYGLSDEQVEYVAQLVKESLAHV